jgi:hypothetical protein
LRKSHGHLWWEDCVDNKTKGDARSSYGNQTGATSSDGSVLISYTYLLQLKKIITDNWPDFSYIFPDRTIFESWINDVNTIRREEAHNRPITHANVGKLQQIYNDILREICQHYPEVVSSYLSNNWRLRISSILEEYSDKQSSRSIGKEIGLVHSMHTVIETISDLYDVETRLSSVPVPPNKIDLHNKLIGLIQSLKFSFEEMIKWTKAGDFTGGEKAGQKNIEVNIRIKLFTEKILLTS